MKTDKVGVLELITFRTTRHHHPYLTPLTAIVQGISGGHIALKLKFYDKELFEQYIEGNDKIPYKILTDQETGEQLYEVYVSFWPHGEYGPWTKSSKLQDYIYDREQSRNYSPVLYNPIFDDYLKPSEKIVASSLPVFRELFKSTIKLPPAIIMHSNRLGLTYGDITDLQNLLPNQSVVAAADNYAIRYSEWKSAIILSQNAKHTLEATDPELLKHNRLVKIAYHRMLISEKSLKDLMFPAQNLSSDEFIDKLEPFVSFGYPEQDTVSLPLCDHSRNAGLELEPMLAYIAHLANNPTDHPYHVFKTNCAQKIMDILWIGGKDSRYSEIRTEFELPWYVRWFSLTITPSLIMQQGEQLQIKMEELNSKLNYEQLIGNDYALIRRKTQPHFNLEPRAKTMKFYHNDDDEDELPTTSLAIFAKLIDNFSNSRW